MNKFYLTLNIIVLFIFVFLFKNIITGKDNDFWYIALTDDEKIVAFLHDVLEDTHYTVEDIKREVTNNDYIIQALELLNHDKSVPYLDYIRKIRDSKNCLAINVKKYDIADNTDPNRGKVYNREKYSVALSILNHELN